MKVFLAFLMALVVCMGATAVQAGLLSNYTFNGTLANSVGGGVTGTMTSGSSTYVTGGPLGGQAISLDGTQAVSIGTSGLPAGSSGTQEGAVSYWVNGNGTGFWGDACIFGSNAWHNPTFQLYLGNDTQGPSMYCRDDQGHVFRTNNTYSGITTGAWHQVTMVYSHANGSANAAYVDGVKDTNVNFSDNYGSPTSYTSPWPTRMLIGGCTDVANGGDGDVGQYVNGKLQDVSVWGAPLTAGKAVAIYGLAADSTLHYGAKDADALFQLFDSQGTGTVGGQTWHYATGLSGADGQVIGHNTVILDAAAGTGMMIPEPSAVMLMASGIIGLLAYAWRKRK